MAGKYDLDVTTLGELLDDPEARAIIVEYAPELPEHPMISMAKGLPANTLLAMAGGQLPADKITQLKTRIQAL
ncbi:MAG TPA: hypothetical protein VNP97_12440 [Microbacterium sp.]|nr:hypothetical protein [Microbacterium sp.]